LFPDTYNVEKDITALEIVNLLTSTFDQKIKNNDINIDNDSTMSVYEIVTLASIIEREAKTDEEKYIIADILLRRLNNEEESQRLLQTDSTLLYELQDWEGVITNDLKEEKSPYNTYLNTGLVPTPICNAGIVSIMALLDPENNEYLYYLHDDEGKIHYAKTLEDHTNNIRCFINKNKEYCL